MHSSSFEALAECGVALITSWLIRAKRQSDRQTSGRTDGGVEKILRCRTAGGVEVEGSEERH